MPDLRYAGDASDRAPLEIMDRDEARDLRERTTAYALAVVQAYCSLPKTEVTRVLGRQLLRSGTSVGAHYREATRARSVAEFISKIEGGQQELEESGYWMELLCKSGSVRPGPLDALVRETEELMAIFAASVTTAKRRRDRR